MSYPGSRDNLPPDAARSSRGISANGRRGATPASAESEADRSTVLADAQHDDADQRRVIAAREKINTCQTKLDRYRAALDAGTDPVLVQQWITQVQAEKAVAEADLRRITDRRTTTPKRSTPWSKPWPASPRSCAKRTLPTKPRSTGNSGSSSPASQASARSKQRPRQVDHVLKACQEIDTNQYPISADLGSRPHFSLTVTRLRRAPRQSVRLSEAAGLSVGHHSKRGAPRI